MENVEIPIMYCIKHGKNEVVFEDRDGVYYHMLSEGISTTDDNICRGPFTITSPPPSLTEEEWNDIFSRELEVA